MLWESAIGLGEYFYNHPEFAAFSDKINQIFIAWRGRYTPVLQSLDTNTKPKTLIYRISEDLLESFAGLRLIDKYDEYQQLMTYWTDVMQDDVYLIALDGWQANADLIPNELIINRYFAAEKAEIENLEAEKENFTREREELEEEHNVEGGKFEDARDDNDKLTKASVKEQIGKLKFGNNTGEEYQPLVKYTRLLEDESAGSREIRRAKIELDVLVFKQYGKLDVDEIKTLVIDDKWMTTLEAAIKAEIERIAQNLTQRIKTLAVRYETPLPQIVGKVGVLSAKIDAHLAKMGFAVEL